MCPSAIVLATLPSLGGILPNAGGTATSGEVAVRTPFNDRQVRETTLRPRHQCGSHSGIRSWAVLNRSRDEEPATPIVRGIVAASQVSLQQVSTGRVLRLTVMVGAWECQTSADAGGASQ